MHDGRSPITPWQNLTQDERSLLEPEDIEAANVPVDQRDNHRHNLLYRDLMFQGSRRGTRDPVDQIRALLFRERYFAMLGPTRTALNPYLREHPTRRFQALLDGRAEGARQRRERHIQAIERLERLLIQRLRRRRRQQQGPT